MEKRFIQAILITLAFFAGVLPSWAEFRLEKDMKLDPGGRFVLESIRKGFPAGPGSSLSGWLRKFVGGQFSGSCPMPARWTVQAVSRACCGVPVGSPVSRTASS